MKVDFNEELHEYRIDGKIVPSVTQLLAPLYAGTFAHVSAENMEYKSELGTAVHLACELHDRGTLDAATVTGVVRPYFEAYLLFLREHCPHWSHIEVPLGSFRGYGGKPDRVGKLRDYGLTTADVKTGASVSPVVGVQLVGYDELVRENVSNHQATARIAIWLRDNGTYRIIQFKEPDDRACFLGLLAKHNWEAKWHKRS